MLSGSKNNNQYVDETRGPDTATQNHILQTYTTIEKSETKHSKLFFLTMSIQWKKKYHINFVQAEENKVFDTVYPNKKNKNIIMLIRLLHSVKIENQIDTNHQVISL